MQNLSRYPMSYREIIKKELAFGIYDAAEYY